MARLEEMGFDFNPVLSGSYITKKRANMFPRVDANWEKHFQNLVKYKKETGNEFPTSSVYCVYIVGIYSCIQLHAER